MTSQVMKRDKKGHKYPQNAWNNALFLKFLQTILVGMQFQHAYHTVLIFAIWHNHYCMVHILTLQSHDSYVHVLIYIP